MQSCLVLDLYAGLSSENYGCPAAGLPDAVDPILNEQQRENPNVHEPKPQLLKVATKRELSGADSIRISADILQESAAISTTRVPISDHPTTESSKR